MDLLLFTHTFFFYNAQLSHIQLYEKSTCGFPIPLYIALKLHPDKNSAPHADEAFKAVGLAYATLSDDQKRRIYDMSGEEDPDNRGGGMRRGGGGGGGHMNFHGQDVSPEDIFNMFFGGGMPPGMGGGMGGPGFRVYSSGFGPGFGNMRAQQQQARARQQQRQQQQQPENILNQLLQFLPLLLIMALSFFSGSDSTSGATGNSRYYSLTPVSPHTNPLHTRLSKVKDIPYYVTDQFVRTIARDRYQLSQVERMVENSYQKYLEGECRNQRIYKRKLELLAGKRSISEAEKVNLMKKANGFELSRCIEFEDLFPGSVREKDRVNRSTQQQQQHHQQQQRQHSEF